MVEAEISSPPTRKVSTEFLRSSADIARICQARSEEEPPPDVFLLSGPSIANSLVAVNAEFLSDGQGLPCPSLPFVGAAFGPDWGYGSVEINLSEDEVADFRLPPGNFETFEGGDIWGYRLCPIDNWEIPELFVQLACIRSELAKPRKVPDQSTGIKVTLTEL